MEIVNRLRNLRLHVKIRLIFPSWKLGIFTVSAILALPLLVIGFSLTQPFSELWLHLTDTLLKHYIINSLILSLGVGLGSFIVGVSCAWLTSVYQFPGRNFFVPALLLPLSMPAYIIAYTYTGLLDYTGLIQTHLRATFGWQFGDYWFPEIRSLSGAICMLSLVLYPYVYLLARASFLNQSSSLINASRSLGNSSWRTFRKVALPLARPAIVAGVSLAMMEALADYGTVQYFGISTFTTGIFRTWFGLGSLATAAQLSALLMVFVLTVLAIERWSRLKMRFYQQPTLQHNTPIALSRWSAAACMCICSLVVALGFILPALQLSVWAFQTYETTIDGAFVQLLINSFLLAAVAAIACLIVALFLAYGKRLQNGLLTPICVRISAMGYAIPGTVIAIGVLIPLAWLDHFIDGWFQHYFKLSTGLLLSGSLFALLFAYVIRFLAVSLQATESGLLTIKPSLDESARSLGYSPRRTIMNIHIPLLRTSLLSALLLVFVDVLKELPATLILRPFNFNTLAVRSYELASDERLADASSAALSIVLIGLIPIILLSRAMQSREQR